MSRDLFSACKDLIRQNKYREAFSCLSEIANNSSVDPAERATAFQGMGGLVQADPSLGDGDQCGLSYYKRALELDPEHLWALLGVVTTFGKHEPDHQEHRAAYAAAVKLMSRISEVPEIDRAFLGEKLSLLHSLNQA